MALPRTMLLLLEEEEESGGSDGSSDSSSTIHHADRVAPVGRPHRVARRDAARAHTRTDRRCRRRRRVARRHGPCRSLTMDLEQGLFGW